MASSKRLALLLLVVLAASSCVSYNPSLYQGYDILSPNEKVRKNPISTFPDPITGESLFVVTYEFISWVAELKAEVLKLRKGAKSSASDPTPQE